MIRALIRIVAGLLLLAGVGPAPARAQGAAMDFPTKLRAEIEAFVRGRAERPPTRVEVPALADFAPPQGVDAEALRTHLRIDPDAAVSGSLPVTVILSAAGREIRRGVVTVRVVFEREAWVAARRLSRGQSVGADDLVRRRVSEERLPADAVARPEELAGLLTRRSVAEGVVLRRSFLEAPLQVARGDLVSLLLLRGPLRIEARGRARDEGRTGEWIRVQNLDSRRELLGRVGADGAVHVDF